MVCLVLNLEIVECGISTALPGFLVPCIIQERLTEWFPECSIDECAQTLLFLSLWVSSNLCPCWDQAGPLPLVQPCPGSVLTANHF